jgi:hypothetical protein
LFEHCIDQGGFAVVNVSNDGDVADVCTLHTTDTIVRVQEGEQIRDDSHTRIIKKTRHKGRGQKAQRLAALCCRSVLYHAAC